MFSNNALEMKGIFGVFLEKNGQFYRYKAAIYSQYKGRGLYEATYLDNSGSEVNGGETAHERALSHNFQWFPQGKIWNKNHAKHAYCATGNRLVSQGGNMR